MWRRSTVVDYCYTLSNWKVNCFLAISWHHKLFVHEKFCVKFYFIWSCRVKFRHRAIRYFQSNFSKQPGLLTKFSIFSSRQICALLFSNPTYYALLTNNLTDTVVNHTMRQHSNHFKRPVAIRKIIIWTSAYTWISNPIGSNSIETQNPLPGKMHLKYRLKNLGSINQLTPLVLLKLEDSGTTKSPGH